jgi:MoxR-like ATPase
MRFTNGEGHFFVTLDEIKQLRLGIEAEIAKAIYGQQQAVGLLLLALLSRGHVLLEGPPGTAKTLLGKCFAAALSLAFGRVQFTPDLMPSDLLCTNLFNF